MSRIALILTTLDFGKEFTAAVGPEAEVADARKFCQLNLQVEYSAGFSFAVYSAEYAGFAELDGGVTGTVASRYYFSGETEQVRSTFCPHRLEGVPFGLPIA